MSQSAPIREKWNEAYCDSAECEQLYRAYAALSAALKDYDRPMEGGK